MDEHYIDARKTDDALEHNGIDNDDGYGGDLELGNFMDVDC